MVEQYSNLIWVILKQNLWIGAISDATYIQEELLLYLLLMIMVIGGKLCITSDGKSRGGTGAGYPCSLVQYTVLVI